MGRHNAQAIIAEIGLDMSRFPTAGHLVSWAKLCPRTIQSGARSSAGKTGKGNRYLLAVLGDAAAGAAKTQTFLGERYRRMVKRRGKLKALVAVARSILVIIWNLLSHPGLSYHDLGVDYHTNRIDTARRTRNHVRQLEALGYTVTLTAGRLNSTNRNQTNPATRTPGHPGLPPVSWIFRSGVSACAEGRGWRVRTSPP